MIENEDMSDDATTAPKVGYKSPPAHAKWKAGQSGNPSGTRKRAAASPLREAIADKINEMCHVQDGGKKIKMSLKQLVIRGLMERAATGNSRALVELIKLSEEIDADDSASGPLWIKMDYSDAMVARDPADMDEAFYVAMEKQKREWLREDQTGQTSIRRLIDREFARKVPAIRNGEEVRVPMLDVIVARFIKEAKDGDMTVFKLLLKLTPEKKLKRGGMRLEYLRPTQSELEQYGPADKTKWPATRH